MKTIGGLFGRSPFGPLREHLLKVQDCVHLLTLLFKAFLDGRQDEVKSLADDISKEEHAADLIKKQLRNHLSKSLFMSISRVDILAMLKDQDSIADACERAAILLSVRRTQLPKELTELLIKTLQEVVDTVQVVCKASDKLVDLEEDVTDHTLNEILVLIEDIQKKEWEADHLQKTFLEKLFSMENGLSPIDIYFLMNILKQVGEIADHADNIGDCMRRILAR